MQPNLSRAVMGHLSSIALVYSCIEQLRQSPGMKQSTFRGHVRHLNTARRCLKRRLLANNGLTCEAVDESKDCDGIKIMLSERQNARLSRYEREYAARVKAALPKEIDARRWLSTVLTLCEQQADKCRDNMAYRLDWAEIIYRLGRLYEYFDPDLEATDEMVAGVRDGERIVG